MTRSNYRIRHYVRIFKFKFVFQPYENIFSLSFKFKFRLTENLTYNVKRFGAN